MIRLLSESSSRPKLVKFKRFFIYLPMTLLTVSLVVLTLPNAVNWIRGDARWSFDANGFQTGLVAALACVGLMQVGKTRGFIYFNF